jgi:hypothetical protein
MLYAAADRMLSHDPRTPPCLCTLSVCSSPLAIGKGFRKESHVARRSSMWSAIIFFWLSLEHGSVEARHNMVIGPRIRDAAGRILLPGSPSHNLFSYFLTPMRNETTKFLARTKSNAVYRDIGTSSLSNEAY